MERKLTKRALYLPLVIAVIFLAGMLIGSYIGRFKLPEQYKVITRGGKVDNILQYISQMYVDSTSYDKLTETAINSMLKELDPHSVYIPASELAEVNEPIEGGFSGIGVQFNMQNDTLYVINTVPNGPSAKVGILPGDRIIRVNDSIIAGKNLPSDKIVKMLKGPEGTKVTVAIKRRGFEKLIYFDIIRAQIPLYSVDIAYMITPKTGFIKINQFSKTTAAEFADAINKLRKQGMKKLILDLRGNGGGLLDAAIEIADQLLDAGNLIVYTEGRARPRENAMATSSGLYQSEPIVVLVDEFSASASEILAGAIQDNDRGTIVGRRTFGKGLVQEQIMLKDGSALRLTVARYYTPTGRSIQKPYTNGTDNYYAEIGDRIQHRELEVADSIHFNDSLQFLTPKGKIVYGGGGIMPDVFIPLDTLGYSPWFAKVQNMGLIYRFALDYTDRNRTILKNQQTVKALSNYLDRKDILNEFVQFASKQSAAPSAKDLNISGSLVKTQIKAYIGRNIFDNEGFYPIIKDIDATLLKALNLIEKE